MRQVPVGRRNLFAERRRAVLGILSAGVTFLLILALDGIVAGVTRQLTAYIDASPATVFVAQPGVTNMHMASSSMPLTNAQAIRSLPGVAWASPILYVADTLSSGETEQLSYVVGYVPGARGGPISLIAGRRPGPGEIVLDQRAAVDLGLRLGDRVRVFNRLWRVSGLTSGLTNIANTVSFVRFQDFAAAAKLQGTASYVLVGGDAAGRLAQRIAASTGLSALPKEAFSAEESRLASSMSAQILQIVRVSAILIGLAVISLMLYAATLSRLREIGVMKAIGATRRRLAAIVLVQALWTVLAAVVLAVVLALVLAWVIGHATIDVPMTLEPAAVLRVGVAGLLLGALGAVAPLIRVWRVDPVTVFRR